MASLTRAGISASRGNFRVTQARNIVRLHSVQYSTMPFLRYRWLLPAGHTAIDLCIAGIWMWQGHKDRAYGSPPPVVSHAADFQESAAVGWDPRSCWDCESP